MRSVLLFVLFSILGAVVAALGMFLYQAYILATSGVSPDAVPIKTMLLEVMELHLYSMYGAVAGGGLGAFWMLVRRWRARRTEVPEEQDMLLHDPDLTIKTIRAKRADEYLAKRQRERQQT